MLAIDWGTTSLRAYRLDPNGTILEQRSSASGILAVENGQFAEALEKIAGDWIAAGNAPVVMSGMIGSRQGWQEVPYVSCPAGAEEIAAGLRKVSWPRGSAWIAPGLTCRDESGTPDVMRGEETQILGVLDQLGPGAHTLCLPGTHSKWVEVRDGKIARFTTHMTGEAFAVLRGHSILGRMMKEGPTDSAGFEAGVRRSAESGGLLHHLFGVRARGLFGELPETASASYLSGILIGHEIRAARGSAGRVHLLCTAQLAQLYGQALSLLGVEPVVLDPDAVTRALYRLSENLTP
jgi:2-dehydro-3-deoxygalactonokinase